MNELFDEAADSTTKSQPEVRFPLLPRDKI